MKCYCLLSMDIVPRRVLQHGQPPFLWYMEVVLPMEVQISSLRIMKDTGLNKDDWIQNRLDQLNLIDEKRLTAVCHGQTYQKQMIKTFNKKVRRQVYEVGDLVIKRIILPQGDLRDKWTPTYEGPFVIKSIFSGGAMILTTMVGDDLPHPVNAYCCTPKFSLPYFSIHVK